MPSGTALILSCDVSGRIFRSPYLFIFLAVQGLHRAPVQHHIPNKSFIFLYQLSALSSLSICNTTSDPWTMAVRGPEPHGVKDPGTTWDSTFGPLIHGSNQPWIENCIFGPGLGNWGWDLKNTVSDLWLVEPENGKPVTQRPAAFTGIKTKSMYEWVSAVRPGFVQGPTVIRNTRVRMTSASVSSRRLRFWWSVLTLPSLSFRVSAFSWRFGCSLCENWWLNKGKRNL